MKFGRLLANFGVCALIAILTSEGSGDFDGASLGPLLVSVAFCVFWDLLDLMMCTNFTAILRKILFWGSVVALMIGQISTVIGELFPHPDDIYSFTDIFSHNGSYFGYSTIKKIVLCGSMPATIAILWMATLVDHYAASRWFTSLLPIGGTVVGGIVGLLIQLLTNLGPVVLFVLTVAVTVAMTIPLIKFYKRNGWILNNEEVLMDYLDGDTDGDYDSSGSSSGRSYSSSSSSSSSYDNDSNDDEYEGNKQLDYYMDDIALDNSRSRNLPFDCSISSDVTFYHYGDDAYFTVDFTIDTSGSSAETQREYNQMINDAQRFQREVVNDLFREGKSLIRRIKQKYKGWPRVNFDVKVGDVSEY